MMACSRAPPSPSPSSSPSPSPSRPSCHQRIDVLAWNPFPSPSPARSSRSIIPIRFRSRVSLLYHMTLCALVCLPMLICFNIPMIHAMEMEYSNSTLFFKSPYFAMGVTTFDVTAEIVRSSPTDGCDQMSPDMAGKAVWIEPYRCSIETKIKNCQQAGCIAGISASAYIVPGEEMWTAWEGSTDPSRLHVPFVHLGRNDAETIREILAEKEARPESRYRVKVVNGTDYVVQLASWHPGSRNDWETAFESTYFTLFFQVFLALSNFIVVIVAARKLRRFWLVRKNRSHFATVPLVCLSLVILGNLERCIYLGVDPMGSRHLLPTFARRFMLSISIPWNFASTLLLIFFWSEAIAKHQEPIPFLSYFKIPFIVTTASLASIDFMFAIIDSLYLTDMLLLPIIEVLYAAVGVVISLLFFIVAFRVIRRFQYEALRRTSCSIWASSATAKENLRIRNESRAKIVRMTQFLVINGIGMLLFLVIVSLTPWEDSNLNTPFSVISKWWLLYAALAIQGACQVCAF